MMVSDKRFKWPNPQSWLMDKARQHFEVGDTVELAAIIQAIVPTLDADFVQDIFQSEMDADGYFTTIDYNERHSDESS